MGEQDNTHYYTDEASIEMGYRFRLAANTDCDTRLGEWYPPTEQQTKFVRMMCRAVRDYGIILSDGAGHRSFGMQV